MVALSAFAYKFISSNTGNWGPLEFHVDYVGIPVHGYYMGFPNGANVRFQWVMIGFLIHVLGLS